MQLSEMYPSKYIKAADLPQPRTLQIQIVQMELIGQDKDNKPVLYFAGEPKGLVMNKTIASQIAFITRNDDTDRWRGAWVELYQDMTQYKGQPIQCVRVRAPQAPSQQYAQPQQQPQQNNNQYAPQQAQPPIAPPTQQPRPNMAPPNAVYDDPNSIPDPGDPLRAGQKAPF